MSNRVKSCAFVLAFMCLFTLAGCGGSGSNGGGSTGGGTTQTIHNEWTWMGGSDTAGQQGTYGTEGTAAAGNIPGARYYPATWTDKSGNFWLFGGEGQDSAGNWGDLNDLWEYIPSAGTWKWVGGTNTATAAEAGVFGIQGQPSASNIPGGRYGATAWTDSSGNFWLFGGYGYDSYSPGDLNDLWEYSGGMWTWVDGSDVPGQYGFFGTQGVPSALNIPEARYGAAGWTDAAGNLWLFGGSDGASYEAGPGRNDLWKFSGGQWTWVNGFPGFINPIIAGIYGTRGTPASTNYPGSRYFASAWTDSSGSLWLFGGFGAGSTTTGPLCDLWEYSDGQWTWVSGSDQANDLGVYGTKGSASAENYPEGRNGAAGWVDSSGNFWVFGGSFAPEIYGGFALDDLWKFSNGQWTWVGGTGSNVFSQTGTYGTEGTAASTNFPGSRRGSANWADTSGNLWLFGGYDPQPEDNDLWKYQP